VKTVSLLPKRKKRNKKMALKACTVGWKETNEYEDKGLTNVERAGFEPGNNVWKRQLLLGILGCCYRLQRDGPVRPPLD
jgi:hypothetical protein